MIRNGKSGLHDRYGMAQPFSIHQWSRGSGEIPDDQMEEGAAIQIKETLWAFTENRIAVRFEYEYCNELEYQEIFWFWLTAILEMKWIEIDKFSGRIHDQDFRLLEKAMNSLWLRYSANLSSSPSMTSCS